EDRRVLYGIAETKLLTQVTELSEPHKSAGHQHACQQQAQTKTGPTVSHVVQQRKEDSQECTPADGTHEKASVCFIFSQEECAGHDAGQDPRINQLRAFED